MWVELYRQSGAVSNSCSPPPQSFFLSLLPVSESKFPKEAFSISATDEAANTVEEQEDVDECQLYLGQLCQHTCTNIWGSYRCGCHQGYILQQDGHSCAPGTVTHHGRLIQTWSLWFKSSGFGWQKINHVGSNGFSAWGLLWICTCTGQLTGTCLWCSPTEPDTSPAWQSK